MSADTPQQTVQEQAQAQTPGADGAPGDGSTPSPGPPAPPEPVVVDDAEPTVVDDADAAEVEGDLDELVTVAAERDEYLALAQRTQADFENYRRRAAREFALAQERGVVKLAKELLPALDNLDRALEAADQDDPLLQGVRLVRSELADALGRMGIESYAPAGEVFDPECHEAMASAPQPPDGAPSGTVVEVYQPGYRLRDHVIRPARVVVAA